MKRSSIQRKTGLPKMRAKLRPVSKKRKSRVGKLGIVRLVGKDLELLRWSCFERDGFRCVECGFYGYLDTLEMAHLRTKRNNGDTLENVRTLCKACHHAEHNPKSVPSKALC